MLLYNSYNRHFVEYPARQFAQNMQWRRSNQLTADGGTGEITCSKVTFIVPTNGACRSFSIRKICFMVKKISVDDYTIYVERRLNLVFRQSCTNRLFYPLQLFLSYSLWIYFLEEETFPCKVKDPLGSGSPFLDKHPAHM